MPNFSFEPEMYPNIFSLRVALVFFFFFSVLNFGINFVIFFDRVVYVTLLGNE